MSIFKKSFLTIPNNILGWPQFLSWFELSQQEDTEHALELFHLIENYVDNQAGCWDLLFEISRSPVDSTHPNSTNDGQLIYYECKVYSYLDKDLVVPLKMRLVCTFC